MSDDLADEVEAINSIYGPGSLIPAGDAGYYILSLPDENEEGDGSGGGGVSLRLQFPPEYPDAPPSVLGTNSTGGNLRGVAARDLDLLREALGNVYQPGQVVLFDAIEEVRRLQGERVGPDQDQSRQQQQEDEGVVYDHTAASNGTVPPDDDEDDGEIPNLDGGLTWIPSSTILESKSTFLAHAIYPVTSPAQASRYITHLLTDKRLRAATHNVSAWRIRHAPGGGQGVVNYQDCDDDGETAAGSRLLHLMQMLDVWDCVVVVSRWFGGVKLGPRRFALINTVARDALMQAGVVGGGEGGGGEKGGKGGGKKKSGK